MFTIHLSLARSYDPQQLTQEKNIYTHNYRDRESEKPTLSIIETKSPLKMCLCQTVVEGSPFNA